jgi:hypothetical protein
MSLHVPPVSRASCLGYRHEYSCHFFCLCHWYRRPHSGTLARELLCRQFALGKLAAWRLFFWQPAHQESASPCQILASCSISQAEALTELPGSLFNCVGASLEPGRLRHILAIVVAGKELMQELPLSFFLCNSDIIISANEILSLRERLNGIYAVRSISRRSMNSSFHALRFRSIWLHSCL